MLKPPGGGTSGLFSTGFEDNQKPIVPQTDSASNLTSNNGLPNGIESINGKAGNALSSETSLTQKESDLDAVSIPSSIISAEIKNLTAQIQKRQQSKCLSLRTGCRISLSHGDLGFEKVADGYVPNCEKHERFEMIER